MACADHPPKRTSRRDAKTPVQTIRIKGQAGEMCNGLCRPSAEKDKQQMHVMACADHLPKRTSTRDV